MRINSQALVDNALVWAVAKAKGLAPVVAATGVAYRSDHGSWVYPRYTEDSEAVTLMASEWIGVERPSQGQTPPMWKAITDNKRPRNPADHYLPVVSAWGETLGLAVCRALVLSRLGETVDVPNELVTRKAA